MFLLRQNGAKAVKGAFEQMSKEGEEIASLAKQMAPIDEGDLERAIRVRIVGGGRAQGGQFARKEVIVEVNTNMRTRDGKQSVGEYAYEIHEHQAPFGTKYRLGKRSLEKQAANPSVIVGGKYLERAVAEREKGLLGRMTAAVRAKLSGP